MKEKNELMPYEREVFYYETDKMGIVHHSNYIRWMEEARVDFLEKIGWSYDQLEKVGLVSPVLAVNAQYNHPTYFGDIVSIDVEILELKTSLQTLKLYLIQRSLPRFQLVLFKAATSSSKKMGLKLTQLCLIS